MNQKEDRRWELRLGLFQVVVLLGLIMGLLTCIFFLGYFSGRQVGHEAALSASLSNTIKLPIGADDRVQAENEGASDRVASEVYAKLNQNRADNAVAHLDQEAVEMPRLGAIDSTADAPVAPQVDSAEVETAKAKLGAQDFPIETVEVSPTISPSREQLLKEVIREEQAAPPIVEVQNEEKLTPPTPTPPQPTPTVKVEPTATPRNTPTPKATKVASAPSDEGSIPKGWFAQVAAPKKKEDANVLASQLRKSGFPVIVEVAQVRGEQYFRILTGPESSKAQAEKLVEQLSREPYVPTKPFIRQIK